MQPLATLPVFFPLAGKLVIVVGGSEGAAWKVDLVAATGAQVDVYTTSPCDKLKELVASRSNVVLHERAVAASDFSGVTLAFGATFDHAEAIAARAAIASAWSNVAPKASVTPLKSDAATARSCKTTLEREATSSLSLSQGDVV